MGRHKELTEMQRKFAHELVTNEGRKNKYECAIDAGYAKDRATSTAAELTNPKKHPLSCSIHWTIERRVSKEI